MPQGDKHQNSISVCRLSSPFVASISNVSTTHSFRHHIKQDVRCYVCLHDNCEHSLKLFHPASEWVRHANNDHGGEWFPSSGPGLGSHCPFCLEAVRDPRIHVQRHMVDIAMFSTDSLAREAKKSGSIHDDDSLRNFDEETDSRGSSRDKWDLEDLEDLGNFQDPGEFQAWDDDAEMSISNLYETVPT